VIAMKKYLYMGISAIILSACGGGFDKTNSQFTEQFNTGNYGVAADIMAQATVANKKPNNLYLGGLQCNAGFLWANDFEASQMCESASGAILTGEADEDSGYTIKDYEPIMLKTYSAIANMATDCDFAAQLFRQAHELQAQNVQDNSSEIEELKQEYAKEAQGVEGIGDIDSIVAAVSAEMETAQDSVVAMKDYVNPYTTYLAAVFNAVNGDLTNAPLDFKRVSDFAPQNGFVKTDLDAIKSDKNFVWVVFENGTVGTLQKRSLAPAILQAVNIKVTIPDVFPGVSAMPYLTVETDAGRVHTEFLANMDSVVKTDYDKYKTRNIISSVTFETAKVAAAAAAKIAAEEVSNHNDNNPWMSLAGDVAMIGIMSAEKPWDLRSWTSLPHEVQIARVEMPRNRTVTINDNFSIEISEDIKNAVIFVRMPTINAEPGFVIGKLN